MIVGGVEIKVDIRPLTAVLPHEETVPELTSKLSKAILADGVQRDPIIVDGSTGTVLDGMHRLSSLREIGAQNVVCHLVDYSSIGVEMRRWVRVLRRTREGVLLPLLESVGIDRVVPMEEALGLVERGGDYVAILTKEKCYVPPEGLRNIAECYDLIKEIDGRSRKLGWEEDFVDEESVHVELSSPSNVVVFAPKLSKQDVLQAARKRRLLPHKTTMHIVDLRPLGVDYPLSELRQERPSKRALIARLTTSRASIMNPPYTHLGRTYNERVMVLEKD